MYFEITEFEVLKFESDHLTIDQILMNILKDKGAPIDGIFYTKLREGYQVTSWKSDSRLMYCFKFEQIPKKPSQDDTLINRGLRYLVSLIK